MRKKRNLVTQEPDKGISVDILDDSIPSPLRLVFHLKFPEEDLKSFPWLRKGDRYYLLEKKLNPGGFSIPILGYPCDYNGTRLPKSCQVIVKIPNLSDKTRYTQREQDQRAAYIREHSIQEWAHIRKRLLKCKHANPIFDLGTHWLNNAKKDIYITVQKFIKDAVPINDWLVKQRLRPEMSYDKENREIQDWHGISNWKEWIKIAILVAEGLAEIHSCRVIHADIWPPNIFIKKGVDPYAIFIDFGESFVMMPTDDPRTQKDHAYRAPERQGGEYVPTEQIDVYSFGKLLLYLAIGVDKIIPHSLHGHRRRAFVRESILDRNPTLIKEHPQVVDVIAQCTALDPVARPRMREVVEEMKALSAKDLVRSIDYFDLTQRLEKIKTSVDTGFDTHNGIFLRFIDKQIAEVERLIDSCATDMIEMDGTRDQLIRALLILFNELGPGDSWTTLTTPSVWQDSALGLDGRYATATIEAIRKGIAVHRTYIVSIEELGLHWAKQFTRRLDETGNESLTRLAQMFRDAIYRFEKYSQTQEYVFRSAEFIKAHGERFVFVAESLKNMERDWELGSYMSSKDFEGIRETAGLYLGLVPVATLSEVRILRTENPVSLMYVNQDGVDEHNKWLLIMTDMRGRNENEPGTVSTPQLRRIRIYRSVMGVPNDRIINLNNLMKGKSINIGSVIQQFAKCVLAVPLSEVGEKGNIS